MTEPWMSGSYAEVNPLLRPLLHAFDHALLDLEHWTANLTQEQLWSTPHNLGSVGFHLRHITGSTDRLFTYAQNEALTETQLQTLNSEKTPGATRDELLAEMRQTFATIAQKVRDLDPATLSEPRFIGRKRLPTTLHSLLVHIAEHTMRHVGQAIITVRVLTNGGLAS
ncbi:MAG: DinB family protein [Acidobacteria bacterium]|nr:DinB family protein [Acidobacteriota bacterium]